VRRLLGRTAPLEELVIDEDTDRVLRLGVVAANLGLAGVPFQRLVQLVPLRVDLDEPVDRLEVLGILAVTGLEHLGQLFVLVAVEEGLDVVALAPGIRGLELLVLVEGLDGTLGGLGALRGLRPGHQDLPASVALVQPQLGEVGDELLRLLEGGHRFFVVAIAEELIAFLHFAAAAHLAAAGADHHYRKKKNDPWNTCAHGLHAVSQGRDPRTERSTYTAGIRRCKRHVRGKRLHPRRSAGSFSSTGPFLSNTVARPF
jgi:hypothetical protein